MEVHRLISKFDKTWIWCLLILVLALGIRCYKFSGKNDLFLDEYLSVVISVYHEDSGSDSWFSGIANDSTTLTGKEVKSILLSDGNSFSDIMKDIKLMRHYTRDAPQTNFYYSFLRLSFLHADEGNMGQIMNRGFLLNILFFLIGFIFFYKLATTLFTNKILVIVVVAIAFLNPASVGNTLFLRPYQLQEVLFIIFSYLFVRNSFSIIDSQKIDTWKNMLLLAFVASLVLLSGYFAIFYVLILASVLIALSYKYKSKNNIPFYIFTFFLAYIFVLVLYVNYNYGLTAGRATESLSKLDGAVIFQNIINSFVSLFSEIKEFYLGLPAIILILLSAIGIFIVKRNSGNDKKVYHWLSFCLAICGIVWMLIVIFFAPYKLVRYIMPILPVISLVIPFIFSYYSKKIQMVLAIIMILLISGKTFLAENLYWGVIPVDKEYLMNEQLPLVIAGSEVMDQVILIPFYSDNRSIEFSFSSESFSQKIEKENEVYAIVSSRYPENYHIPENYQIVEISNINEFLKLYKLIRVHNEKSDS